MVGGQVAIRPAQASDASGIVELVSSILAREFPADQAAFEVDDLRQLTQSYSAPQSAFFVAEEKGRIVGTCGVKADGPWAALLRRLFVDSEFRGKGIGTALLKEALDFCRTAGYQEVVISTSTRMAQAIRLCKALGFREEGSWGLGPVTLIRFHLRLNPAKGGIQDSGGAG